MRIQFENVATCCGRVTAVPGGAGGALGTAFAVGTPG